MQCVAIADVNLGVASALPFHDSDAEKENVGVKTTEMQ